MKNNARLAATGLGAASLVALSLMAISPQAQADGRKVVPNSTPGWVADTASTGDVAGRSTAHFRVYLAPNGGIDALKQAVVAVSTPGSGQYGTFLSAAQYHAAYDPTAASVSAVGTYLKASGLKVVSVDAHRRYLDMAGPAADVESALGTTLKTFQHDGQSVQANTSAVKLPDSIAASVLTVTGLDTTVHTMKPAVPTPAPPPAGFNNGRPCSAYYGQLAAKYQADYQTPLPKFQGKVLPYAVCGYTGPQFRAAYQGANRKGLSGQGVTIGVIDAYAAPTIAQDASTYAANHGDGGYASGQLTQVTPTKYKHQAACDPSGWFGEETLDIEAEHAMAPGANIRYYGAVSCYDTDFLDTLTNVVDEDQVALVSNSYGEPDQAETASAIAAYQQVFLQGAMQGISFTFSSGDDGDELANTGIKQTDSSGSSPYVTAVGGTSDDIGADGSMQAQTGWGTQKYSLSSDGTSWLPVGYLYGAGGGTSTLYNEPSYQQGVVPSANANGRAVPDISMDADPTTGMLVGETQTFSDGVRYGEYRIGGTSLASPLLAGQVALLIQNNGGRRLGLLNPLIYGKMRTSGALTDIQSPLPDVGNIRVDYANGENDSKGLLYSVRTFDQDSSLAIAPGWDDVTGVGSPNPSFINLKVK